MSATRLKVGIVGCGNIAGPYAADLQTYPEIELTGVTDMDAQRAQEFGEKHNTRVYPDLDALLADPQIDVVVNLTTHYAHKAVTAQALNTGKHVYSEKPLALTYEEAIGLVDLARQKGRRLACSPFTLIGEAQQTAWKLIRDGKLGIVRVAYAEVNWGRIESWHPAPLPFYGVGPLYDVGVYPLTILTAMFGPARRVTAFGSVVYPDRVTKEGVPFHLDTPEFVTAVYELNSGVIVRLTTDFYVSNRTTRQVGIEFHGDLGSVHLESWQLFDSTVSFAEFGEALKPVPLLREPYKGTPWGRGVYQFVKAILSDQPHRFTGEHAAHVMEVLEATTQSVRWQRAQPIVSDFPAPQPADWAM
jgi:predicted dehydrogenase